MPIDIWIAAIGMGVLIVFAVAAYFRALLLPTKNDRSLYPILRVLLSLLAGFAAWFISGIALLSVNTTIRQNQMAISGSMGFALFFAVFYAMRQPVPQKTQSSVTVDVAPGFTFADTARKIAGPNKNVRWKGFTDEQLRAPLLPGKLGPLPTIHALCHLGRLVESHDFPTYDVRYEAPIYVLQVNGAPQVLAEIRRDRRR
jgi:hypothetical protein